MLLLAPVSIVIVLAARPLATLLLAGVPRCQQAAAITVSTHMLVVFAPQVLLYGLAVVLYGILQAHRRFTAPALAPVVSSLVVIAAYLAFVPLGGAYRNNLAGLPVSAELVLAAGTTAGVAALMFTALGPAMRLRLRLRPTLRFPPGVAQRVRALGSGLPQLVGLSYLSAARIIGEVGDIGRIESKARFARMNGTAPIPASSGQTQRHRLNQGGNRRLNHVLHMMALTQARMDPRARAYVERRRTGGKSRRDAIRALKRHLSDVVYQQLRLDARLGSLAAAD